MPAWHPRQASSPAPLHKTAPWATTYIAKWIDRHWILYKCHSRTHGCCVPDAAHEKSVERWHHSVTLEDETHIRPDLQSRVLPIETRGPRWEHPRPMKIARWRIFSVVPNECDGWQRGQRYVNLHGTPIASQREVSFSPLSGRAAVRIPPSKGQTHFKAWHCFS